MVRVGEIFRELVTDESSIITQDLNRVGQNFRELVITGPMNWCPNCVLLLIYSCLCMHKVEFCAYGGCTYVRTLDRTVRMVDRTVRALDRIVRTVLVCT